MRAKCICKIPDIGNWTVIHITGRDRVIRCSECHQIWHSFAAYTNEIPEQLVSPYEWRHLIRTPDYHKGESEFEGEEDSYLDPAFESRFDRENHEA